MPLEIIFLVQKSRELMKARLYTRCRDLTTNLWGIAHGKTAFTEIKGKEGKSMNIEWNMLFPIEVASMVVRNCQLVDDEEN